MRKIICFALALVMLLSLAACGPQTQADTQPPTASAPAATPAPVYSDPELARAVALGIGSYAEDEAVTYKQFFAMLDSAVELADPSVLPAWGQQLSDARASEAPMTRQEGMLAVFYAAQALGKEYAKTNTYWRELNAILGDDVSGIFTWEYPLLPGWDKLGYIDGDQCNNQMVAAYYFSFGKASVCSDKTIFDYDPDMNSMRTSDPFTYTEALLAALRLYESNLQPTDRVSTEEDEAVLNMADERRDAILNSKTDVTAAGSSYYVSNSGNDQNNGTTPETAWATTDKVNHTEFEPGDAVFFERGGIFRGILCYKSDITYSAYGTGSKPRIYGSPENGADPGKWALVDGTENVWEFYRDMYDTGGIVFNEGESWAIRRTVIWNGEEYVDRIDNTLIDITKLKDLYFYSLPDYTGLSSEEAGSEMGTTGKLYLRCDAGNPGEVYNSIEFLCGGITNIGGTFVIQTGPNSVIDNLCLMYNSGGGISVASNCVVQNCEVGWMGGTISAFSGAWVGENKLDVVRCGDGILIAQGTDSVVSENYVHHLYDFGITVETGPWLSDEDRHAYNMAISNNLVERCSGGCLVGDWPALASYSDSQPLFDNIAISNNYFMYMGYGWSHLKPDYDGGEEDQINNGNCNVVMGFPAKTGNNISVEDNVFYLSTYALVGGMMGPFGQEQEYTVSFSGNTYVQNNRGLLAEWPDRGNYSYWRRAFYNLSAKETIMELLGDDSAVVLTPDMDGDS